MPTSEAQIRAVRKWEKENAERLTLSLRKGTKERWKQLAAAKNMSLTGMISRAVEEYNK